MVFRALMAMVIVVGTFLLCIEGTAFFMSRKNASQNLDGELLNNNMLFDN